MEIINIIVKAFLFIFFLFVNIILYAILILTFGGGKNENN